EIGDFELSHDGRKLAFGLRGRFGGIFGLEGNFSGAVTLDLATRRLSILTSEQACQTTWAPDDQHVLWMETGGNGGAPGQDRGPGRDRPPRLHGPSGAVQPRVLPETLQRWALARVGRRGRRSRARPGRLRDLRVGDRDSLGARGPPDAPHGQRSVA